MKLASLTFVFFFLAAPALAQQSEPLWRPFAAAFDADAPILLQGRIVRADWLEPKSVIWVEGVIGTGEKKKLWRDDTAAASLFTEQERASLTPDVEVVVRGYNAKEASCSLACRMAARDFTLPTGVKLLPKSGTGVCRLDQLLTNACPQAFRPGPPPMVN